VLHTVNRGCLPSRSSTSSITAENRVLFFDITFADLVSKLRPKLATVAQLVAMTDEAHAPGGVSSCLVYEALLAAEDDAFEWPAFDERTASSLCYTSGTTGNPKGVLYSHRRRCCTPSCLLQRRTEALERRQRAAGRRGAADPPMTTRSACPGEIQDRIVLDN